MKRAGIVAIVILLSLSSPGNFLRADTINTNYRLSLSPLFGMLWGQAAFLLYNPDRDQYASELLWDLKPLWYVGLAVDFGPQDPFRRGGFGAAASLKFGLPLRTGHMEDRDWIDRDYDYLTHFSRHYAFSQSAIMLDVCAGYTWVLGHSLALRLYGAYSYMRFSWMAEDGFIQYASRRCECATLFGCNCNLFHPWDENIPKRPIFGPGVRYVQNWHIVSPGISLKGRIGNNFTWQGGFRYTPLVFCIHLDDHHFRDISFSGRFAFSHFFEGSGRFTFSPNERLELSLAAAYRHIARMRGNAYVHFNGLGPHPEDPRFVGGNIVRNFFDGGAGFSALDVRLAARIRLW